MTDLSTVQSGCVPNDCRTLKVFYRSRCTLSYRSTDWLRPLRDR